MLKPPVVASILALFVLAGIAAFVLVSPSVSQPTECTTEAKICPDGSAVGRTGPNCEFASCLDIATSTASPSVVGEGKHCGGFIKDAPTCAPTLHCELTVSRPDTGGVCVRNSTSGEGANQYHSRIRGVALLGPTCPVMREPPEAQCADKPYQTNLVITSPDGARVIQTFSSDAKGMFDVAVPPGTYAIRSAAVANIRPYCSSNGTFTVAASATVDVPVSCDTGIR